MRQVNAAEYVLNMWLAGFTWFDVTKTPAFCGSDAVARDALATLWTRMEWANAQNIHWSGIETPHRLDVRRRHNRKSSNGR